MRTIYINGVYLDLENDNVSITFASNPIGQLAVRDGIASNEFEVRLSQNNRDSFDYAFLFAREDGAIDASTQIPGRIEQDNQTVARGFFQVVKFNEEIVNLNFFSGNSDWISFIKDKSIRDLNLDRYIHQWTVEEVIRASKYTEGYTYPLVDYGRLRTIQTREFILQDFYPAMYCKTLLQQIFADAGITLAGSFIEDFEYTNSIIPFSLDKFSSDDGDSVSVVQLTAPQTRTDLQTILFDSVVDGNEDNIDLVANSYTNNNPNQIALRIQGIMSFTFVDAGSGNAEPPFTLLRALPSGESRIDILTTNLPASDPLFPIDYLLPFDHTITLDPGQSVTLETGSANLALITAIVEVGEISLVTFGESSIGSGGFVVPQALLPDINQDALVEYFTVTFGLITQYDSYSKTLYLNKFSDVLANKSIAKDWTVKLDTAKEIITDQQELTKNYARINTLSYASNSETDGEEYEQDNGVTFGSGSFDISNIFQTGSTSFYEAIFAGSLQNRINLNDPSNPFYMPEITILEEDEGQFTIENDAGARILLCKPNANVIADLGQLGVTLEGEFLDEVCYSWFYKPFLGGDLDNLSPQLAFDHPYKNEFKQGSVVKDTYWAEIIRSLQENKYYKAYFKLDIVDISDFNPSIPIYLNPYGYFYIDIIEDYDAEAGSYLCYLVKI